MATPEELAAGVSIGRAGLDLPPRPPVVSVMPRPATSGMIAGPSTFFILFCYFIYFLL